MSSRNNIASTRITQVWFLTYPKCLTWASVTVQAAIGGFREPLFLVDFLVLTVVLTHSTTHKLLVLYWVIHPYGNCMKLIISVEFDWNCNAVAITPRWENAGLPLKLPRRSVSMAEVSHFSCVLPCLTETPLTMNDKNTEQAPKHITEWNSYFQKTAQPPTLSGIFLSGKTHQQIKTPFLLPWLKDRYNLGEREKGNLGKWHVSRWQKISGPLSLHLHLHIGKKYIYNPDIYIWKCRT